LRLFLLFFSFRSQLSLPANCDSYHPPTTPAYPSFSFSALHSRRDNRSPFFFFSLPKSLLPFRFSFASHQFRSTAENSQSYLPRQQADEEMASFPLPFFSFSGIPPLLYVTFSTWLWTMPARHFISTTRASLFFFPPLYGPSSFLLFHQVERARGSFLPENEGSPFFPSLPRIFLLAHGQRSTLWFFPFGWISLLLFPFFGMIFFDYPGHRHKGGGTSSTAFRQAPPPSFPFFSFVQRSVFLPSQRREKHSFPKKRSPFFPFFFPPRVLQGFFSARANRDRRLLCPLFFPRLSSFLLLGVARGTCEDFFLVECCRSGKGFIPPLFFLLHRPSVSPFFFFTAM